MKETGWLKRNKGISIRFARQKFFAEGKRQTVMLSDDDDEMVCKNDVPF